MKKNTREKILEAGAEIIHLKGFNHTGIQEILQTAGVPKGSFYNYFKSKEAFGLEVIDHFVAHFDGLAESISENEALLPLSRIRAMLDGFIDFFESKDFAYGCPIGNLSQEMGDLSPRFRDKLKEAMASMTDWYLTGLMEARQAGELKETLDANETAYFIVSSWQGALVRMKIEKSRRPLENHLHYIFNHVLKS